jgi:Mg-chelatase subunit ChlD
VSEGDEAREAVADAARRTNSRRDLARHVRFEQVSPEVGVLDEDAFREAFEEAPDDALAMLAELTGATDPALRELARRLAGRIVVDTARLGSPSRRGIGRLARVPIGTAEGDLDLDASMEAIAAGPTRRAPGDAGGLLVSTWRRPATAVCLLVDRSGSMAGDRLATAAVAAAAVVERAPLDCSVVCFSDRAVVVKAQDEDRRAESVVNDVLRLRGNGVTDVGLALRTAAGQLRRSNAGRRLAVLLSDCRATTGGDPLPHAGGIQELAVLAPAGDTADAEALATALGASWTELAGPSSAAEALERVLG